MQSWLDVLIRGALDVALVAITAFVTWKVGRSASKEDRVRDDALRVIEDTARYVNEWAEWMRELILTRSLEGQEVKRGDWPRVDLAVCGDIETVRLMGDARHAMTMYHLDGEGDRADLWEKVDRARAAVLDDLHKQRQRVLGGAHVTYLDRTAVASALDRPTDAMRRKLAELADWEQQLAEQQLAEAEATPARDGPPSE